MSDDTTADALESFHSAHVFLQDWEGDSGYCATLVVHSTGKRATGMVSRPGYVGKAILSLGGKGDVATVEIDALVAHGTEVTFELPADWQGMVKRHRETKPSTVIRAKVAGSPLPDTNGVAQLRAATTRAPRRSPL